MDNVRKRMIFDATAWTFALLVASILVGREALAKDGPFPLTSPVYKAECGSCHVAFPPALLPATSWRAVLDGLKEHFGTDASVDAASLAEIRTFLDSSTGRDRRDRAATPGLRITETDWFRREHREVPGPMWKDAAVKRASNCAACHSGAETGDYSERGVRVPR
jgi:hypothetical protein